MAKTILSFEEYSANLKGVDKASEGNAFGAAFSGAGSYNIKLDVDQSALSFGNAVNAAFGSPGKLPHAFLVLTF